MLFFHLLVLTLLTFSAYAITFRDVSIPAGIRRVSTTKYGGASVADLDGDGYPDLIFGYHDQRDADVYFNRGDGTFQLANWRFFTDIHSFVPFHPNPSVNTMSFFLAQGGSFGRIPRPPILFTVSERRGISKVGNITFGAGRGRSVVVMSLRKKPAIVNDVVVLNAPPSDSSDERQVGGTILTNNRIVRRFSQSISKLQNNFGSSIDVDMDGKMELVTFQDLTIHKVVGYFRLEDITDRVIPKEVLRFATVAVAEFDYDNDGLMDLYISRTITNDLRWLTNRAGRNPNDYLLRNVGGRYIDVTQKALIPGGGESRGATVGDFNNDGWMDILVTQYTGPDRLLINNRDGTFRHESPTYFKSPNTRGDQPVAVDYDRDGHLDVILSEGHFFNRSRGGNYRIMKNIKDTQSGNWLLVRVGSSPTRLVSSLHALVTVQTNSVSMIRRVGSPGTTVSISYIELLHFGLGGANQVAKVTVRWTDGVVRTRTNVQAGQLLSFGI